MATPIREIRELLMPAFYDATTPHERRFSGLHCDYVYDRIVLSLGNEISGIVVRDDIDDGTYMEKFKERLQVYLDQWKKAA